MLRVLGIDPGSVSGAYALLTNGVPPLGRTAQCDDLPVVDRMVNAAEFARIVRALKPDVAVIEQVSAMPKQGAVSGFRFGQGVGTIRGVLAGMEIPIVQVSATRWKKFYSLNSDKERSRALAIRMWPQLPNLSRVKDHGRAEALLIAHWHMETTRV